MNDIQNSILKKIVNPAIKQVRNSVRGYVAVVYEDERKVDIYYKDHNNATRLAPMIDFPKHGDGVFSESLEAGDMVELTYRSQSQRELYISQVKKRHQGASDFYLNKGVSLPVSTDLF